MHVSWPGDMNGNNIIVTEGFEHGKAIFAKHSLQNCEGTGPDILSDWVGTENDCKTQCAKLGDPCVGFVHVAGPAGSFRSAAGHAGKCHFRSGQLQRPRFDDADEMSCYERVSSTAPTVTSVNLHFVWDEGLISRTQEIHHLTWKDYAVKLVDQVKMGFYKDDAVHWADCLAVKETGGVVNVKTCIGEMASESSTIACESAHTDEFGAVIQNGAILRDAYYQTRARIVDQRLAQGGVRLAALLRYVFSTQVSPQSQPPATPITTAGNTTVLARMNMAAIIAKSFRLSQRKKSLR